MPVMLETSGPRLEIPHRHGLIDRAGDDASAVGAHRHGHHPTLMPGELMESSPGLEVPDRHGRIPDPETRH